MNKHSQVVKLLETKNFLEDHQLLQTNNTFLDEDLALDNRRITARDHSDAVGISKGSVNTIFLGLNLVKPQLVPKRFNFFEKRVLAFPDFIAKNSMHNVPQKTYSPGLTP